MTFTMPRTVLVVFDDGSPYHGAEVRCKANIPIREALELQDLANSEPGNDRMVALVERFSEYIVDWNLVDENGEAIPVSAVMEQPAGFVMNLFRAWTEATVGVPKDSSTESTNGAMSQEELDLMAQQSQSLTN